MALWPASLTAEQSYHLNKAALKTGKADKEEVGLYRRSKILDRSVYCTFWLRSLRCQYRIQTNGHWLLAVPAWWQKKQLHSVSPLSASAHRENARYARLPIQPCLHLRRRFPKIYLWLFFSGLNLTVGHMRQPLLSPSLRLFLSPKCSVSMKRPEDAISSSLSRCQAAILRGPSLLNSA